MALHFSSSIATTSSGILQTCHNKLVSGLKSCGEISFTGNGLTASAPNNLLHSKGAEIVINNGFSAKNVTLGGNVFIEADPPLGPDSRTIYIPAQTTNSTASHRVDDIIFGAKALPAKAIQTQVFHCLVDQR